MKIKEKYFPGGIDAKIFDSRPFFIETRAIKDLCEEFSLGVFKKAESEEKILVSHSNFILFVQTKKGDFVFKFHSQGGARTYAQEYALSRFLGRCGLHVPQMLTASSHRPCLKFNEFFVTCYKRIDAFPLYAARWGVREIKKLCSALTVFKSLLNSPEAAKAGFFLSPGLKQNPVMPLYAENRELLFSLTKPERKAVGHLLDYLRGAFGKEDFSRSCVLIHNNLSLANILFQKNNFYFLDLTHVRPDFVLSDLAGLIVSCHLFSIPQSRIIALQNGYFAQKDGCRHGEEFLGPLVLLRLLKELAKTQKRLAGAREKPSPPQEYVTALKERKKQLFGFIDLWVNQMKKPYEK